MKIVCDTGAVITLEKLKNGFDLARKLFNKIIIPPAVFEELSFAYQSSNDYLKKFKVEDFIEVVKPLEKETAEGFNSLHKGEQEAISLARQLNLDLLIEEKAGRMVAENAGIQISGVAGQILKLYNKEIISKAKYNVILLELFQKRRLSKSLYEALQNRVE